MSAIGTVLDAVEAGEALDVVIDIVRRQTGHSPETKVIALTNKIIVLHSLL